MNFSDIKIDDMFSEFIVEEEVQSTIVAMSQKGNSPGFIKAYTELVYQRGCMDMLKEIEEEKRK